MAKHRFSPPLAGIDSLAFRLLRVYTHLRTIEPSQGVFSPRRGIGEEREVQTAFWSGRADRASAGRTLRRRHGVRDARAERRSEPVPVEGAQGTDSAGGAPDSFLPPGASDCFCLAGTAHTIGRHASAHAALLPPEFLARQPLRGPRAAYD